MIRALIADDEWAARAKLSAWLAEQGDILVVAQPEGGLAAADVLAREAIDAHHLDPWRLPLALEVTLLVGATVAGCWLFYELGRRIGWLRVWIGLAPLSPNGHR